MEKTLIINWDNPSDLKKNISLLQKRRKEILRQLGYNQIKFNNSKYNIDTLLPIFNNMFDAVEYQEGNYYVYFHCNPLKKLNVAGNIKDLFLATKFSFLTHIPFYVGKGQGNRYLDLNRNDSHRKIRNQCLKMKQEIIPVKIIENVSEFTALQYENIFMYILGLRALSEHGLLCNLVENEDVPLFKRISSTDEQKKILKKNGFKFI